MFVYVACLTLHFFLFPSLPFSSKLMSFLIDVVVIEGGILPVVVVVVDVFVYLISMVGI